MQGAVAAAARSRPTACVAEASGAADAPPPAPQPPPPPVATPLRVPRALTFVLALAGGGGVAAALPPPAQARPRPVDLADGNGTALAYEFAVPLRVVALRGSVPSAWVAQFRQTQGKLARVYFSQRAQLAALFAELRAGGGGANSAANADAVTVGDSWLGQAVAGGLIAPIPRAEASFWLARLPPRWAPLLRRRACDGACCPDAPVWGVPYRWGCVLFAVRTEHAATAGVADWTDLLRPELARRVAAPDAPRLLLSAALRSLGVSANCAGLGALAAAGATAAQLLDRLTTLRRQLLTQHAEQHLQALAAGDAWVAIGSSSDLLPFAMRTPGVTVVAPASGTLLWADLWALPAARAADPSPLLRQWHEFTTQPARAEAAAGLKPGASPLLLPPAAPADAHRGAPPACFADLERGVWPRRAVLERSEFMLPLPQAAQDEFAALMAAA